MAVLLSIRTGLSTNPIILVMKHVLRCMEAIAGYLGIGIINVVRNLGNIFVRK